MTVTTRACTVPLARDYVYDHTILYSTPSDYDYDHKDDGGQRKGGLESKRGPPDVYVLEVNPLPAIGKDATKYPALGAAKAAYAAEAAAMLSGSLGDRATIDRLHAFAELEADHKRQDDALEAKRWADTARASKDLAGGGQPRPLTIAETRAVKKRREFRRRKKQRLLPAKATAPIHERFLWCTEVVTKSLARRSSEAGRVDQTPRLELVREVMQELTLATLEFDRRGAFSFVPLRSSVVPTAPAPSQALYDAASGALVEWAHLSARRFPAQRYKPRRSPRGAEPPGTTRGEVPPLGDFGLPEDEEDDDDDDEVDDGPQWTAADYAEI